MSSIEISAIAFTFSFGGALLGMFIGPRLPKHHIDAETKEVVRLGMGLVGTIAGIALGLLISSAYSYYNKQTDELVQMSADVSSLGRLLQQYGPEANGVRESLRVAIQRILAENWPNDRLEKRFAATAAPAADVYNQLRALTPQDDEHRMMKSEATSLLKSVVLMRSLVIEQSSTTVLRPLLFVMIFWLTAIFVSWGLFSSPNATAVATFFVAALCVSGAILMILELYTPYGGLLRLSSAPLRLAYEALGRQ